MRLLVLDNYGSFSLVPYLKERFDDIWTMGNVLNDHMWNVFVQNSPDVVFVDFCNENAVALTERVKGLKKRPKIIIRLHGYEAQSWYMSKIDWNMVSDLIVVSPKFKEIVEGKISGVNVHVVSNGVDLQRFQLQEEFDDDAIAYVGFLNKKKGPTLLRTVMASMPHKHFHVGGVHQDEQVRLYFEDLRLPNATYYGWVRTEEFLKGKRFILSTSVTESFGMGIAEGMAMGLTPMVHAWPGADLVWPKECIWKTFGELERMLPLDPSYCRKWIEDRYSMDKCVEAVVKLIEVPSFGNVRYG